MPFEDASRRLRPPASFAKLRARLSHSTNESPPVVPDHEMIRVIGSGAYGEVWLTRSMLGTLRAVKVIRRSSFDSARPYERELRGISQFEPVSRGHEALVDILQVGRAPDDEYFYYVMELADNVAPTADDPGAYVPHTLTSDLTTVGKLSAARCVALFPGLAAGLQFLHARGLVHRDIKPSNIIFVNGVPKLADIGLVATLDETRSWVGTDGYMPPEGPGTPAADIFSLGKVLYEAATGRDRREFPELPVACSPNDSGLMELNAIWLRACAPKAGDRYVSAAAMATDLAYVGSGGSLRKRKFKRRVFLGSGMMAAAAAGAFALWRKSEPLGQERLMALEQMAWSPPEPDAPVIPDLPRHRYLTCLPNGILVVRDLLSHAEIFRIDVAGENLPMARFITLSPDGQWMALTGVDQVLRFRRVRENAGAYGTRRDASSVEQAVAFSQDHHHVVWADKVGRLQFSDTRNFGVGRSTLEIAGEIQHLAWAPDDLQLAVVTANPNALLLVNAATLAISSTSPLPGTPHHVTWQDGKSIVIATAAGLLQGQPGKWGTLLETPCLSYVPGSKPNIWTAITNSGQLVLQTAKPQARLALASTEGKFPDRLSMTADAGLIACSGVSQRSLRLFRH